MEPHQNLLVLIKRSLLTVLQLFVPALNKNDHTDILNSVNNLGTMNA